MILMRSLTLKICDYLFARDSQLYIINRYFDRISLLSREQPRLKSTKKNNQVNNSAKLIARYNPSYI